MADEKGLLTKEQEKQIAQVIDDALKLKGLGELVDGFAARAIVSMVDDNLAEKLNIKEQLKQDLQGVIDGALSGDVDKVQELSAKILNDEIDIPGLDEDAEALLFKGAVEIILGAALQKAQSK